METETYFVIAFILGVIIYLIYDSFQYIGQIDYTDGKYYLKISKTTDRYTYISEYQMYLRYKIYFIKFYKPLYLGEITNRISRSSTLNQDIIGDYAKSKILKAIDEYVNEKYSKYLFKKKFPIHKRKFYSDTKLEIELNESKK